MNRYKLVKAGVNPTEGIARFGGDKDAYETILNNFASDEQYGLLCAAVEAEDVKAAFAAAHSLKGVAGNLSMTRLFDDVVPLVEELRGGSMAHAGELLENVKRDYDEVLAAIGPGARP